MSLTNYVVQISVLELMSYGFGLSVTRPTGLAVAALFFAVQVLYSKWWFRRFRIGPLEWLWRSLTYGARQPLRIAEPAVHVQASY
jgi:uncharacterized protein